MSISWVMAVTVVPRVAVTQGNRCWWGVGRYDYVEEISPGSIISTQKCIKMLRAAFQYLPVH